MIKERVLKTYVATRPLQIAGFLNTAMGEMEHPAFITISGGLLRKICVDLKRDWNQNHPGGLDAQGLTPEASGEKTFQTAMMLKKFLGKSLLIDASNNYDSTAKLSDLNLNICILVKYEPQ